MNEKKYIPAFTGIRALCAYGIFFYHVDLFSKDTQPGLYTLVDQFYSFIPFFFVISGFVIFYTYYRERPFTKTELYNYFVSRIARIFPILILINTAVFLLSYRENLYSAGQTIKLYFLNITLLKGFSSTYLLTGIGPSWTNTVEEVFYLLAPLVFIAVRKKYFLLRFVLLFYGLGFLISFLFIRNPWQGLFSSYAFTAYFTFFGRVFEFATGIYLAMLYMNLCKNKFLEKYGAGTLAAGLVLLAVCFASQYLIATQNNVAHANETWAGILINNYLFPVSIFLMLYHLLYHGSVFKRFLSAPVMVKLGAATYSFYLLHTTFVLSYIYKFISKNVLVAFISMIIISYIFYRLIEQPLAKLIKRKFFRKA